MTSKTNPINEFICSTIRKIRLEKGLRVQDMSQRSGIPLGSYSCLETGRYRLNLENLFRILHVLGVDISKIWPGRVSKPAERVDSAFVERAVEQAQARQPRLPTIDDILAAVCATFRVDPAQLASPSRRRDLAEARTAATALTKEMRHLSLVSLSQRFGRDVSSLSHCLKRLNERLTYDRHLAERIHAARSHLRRMMRDST